jgi:hypothetical protein
MPPTTFSSEATASGRSTQPGVKPTQISRYRSGSTTSANDPKSCAFNSPMYRSYTRLFSSLVTRLLFSEHLLHQRAYLRKRHVPRRLPGRLGLHQTSTPLAN